MMLTEQPNPRSEQIDQLSTLEVLQLMNEEDAKVAQVVQAALPDIAQAVDAIVAGIEKGGRLVYVGAGTSGRLGVLDAAECVPTFNTPPNLVIGIIAGGEVALTTAIEGAEDSVENGWRDLEAIDLNKRDIVVGIAASGRTPYVLGAVAYATEVGLVTIGIACNSPAPLLDAAQIKIGIPVGPEIITGSTRLKAGTAQKMVLNMLSTASMVRLGKVYGNRMVDLRATNKKLVHRAEWIVADIAQVSLDEAQRLLMLAENDVKVAIVVARLHVTPDEARHMLVTAGGRLRTVIG
jgi:N-acetylmuramic acid 6-phosphate etherase